MNAKTVVFGSTFYEQLCLAIQSNTLEETRGITNRLSTALKRYQFCTQPKDIERIIIVMHQATSTKSLRKMTEEQRQVHKLSHMSKQSTFPVLTGHYLYKC